jgi:hypothetical protein
MAARTVFAVVLCLAAAGCALGERPRRRARPPWAGPPATRAPLPPRAPAAPAALAAPRPRAARRSCPRGRRRCDCGRAAASSPRACPHGAAAAAAPRRRLAQTAQTPPRPRVPRPARRALGPARRRRPKHLRPAPRPMPTPPPRASPTRLHTPPQPTPHTTPSPTTPPPPAPSLPPRAASIESAPEAARPAAKVDATAAPAPANVSDLLPLLGGAAPAAAAAAAPADGAAAAPASDVDAALARGEAVQVVVSFKDAAVAEAVAAAAAEPVAASATAAAAPADGAAAPAHVEAHVRAFALVKAKAMNAASAAGARVEADFTHMPVSVVTVTSPAALAALRADASVASVAPVARHTRAMTRSLPLINQPAAVSAGASGAGCAVAIIDGGGNYGAADLGSCASPGAPAPCRVAFAKDFTSENSFTNTDPHSTNGEGDAFLGSRPPQPPPTPLAPPPRTRAPPRPAPHAPPPRPAPCSRVDRRARRARRQHPAARRVQGPVRVRHRHPRRDQLGGWPVLGRCSAPVGWAACSRPLFGSRRGRRAALQLKRAGSHPAPPPSSLPRPPNSLPPTPPPTQPRSSPTRPPTASAPSTCRSATAARTPPAARPPRTSPRSRPSAPPASFPPSPPATRCAGRRLPRARRGHAWSGAVGPPPALRHLPQRPARSAPRSLPPTPPPLPQYYNNAISGPACAPSAVAVGAVHSYNHGAFDSCDTVRGPAGGLGSGLGSGLG